LNRLAHLPQIVGASLNGPGIGIGVHLALCADMVLAVDTAYFWIPEASLGIVDVLHYRFLEQKLGRSAAFAMLLLGKKLPAVDAVKQGVIAELFADKIQLNAGVNDYLARLRAVSTPVRTAFKRYTSTLSGRSDPAAQLAASAYVLDRKRPT
jgi:enoyl-CoA hydratase/carnithine racemase